MLTFSGRAVLLISTAARLVEGWSIWSETPGSTTCAWPGGIQFRFPPTVNKSLDATWTTPPEGWLYGSWKVRFSSRAVYTHLYNFEADTYPALPTNVSIPAGRNIDLTSFQIAPTGNATIDNAVITIFGYDYPQTDIAPHVFQFRGTGSQSATINNWELLAWGYDQSGDEWRAEYETAYRTATQYGEPCINILSRAEDGPDTETYQKILDAMRETFTSQPDLFVYISNITELPRDGRRVGQSPIACDLACMENAEA